jgi:hypothetical protein
MEFICLTVGLTKILGNLLIQYHRIVTLVCCSIVKGFMIEYYHYTIFLRLDNMGNRYAPGTRNLLIVGICNNRSGIKPHLLSWPTQQKRQYPTNHHHRQRNSCCFHKTNFTVQQ